MTSEPGRPPPRRPRGPDRRLPAEPVAEVDPAGTGGAGAAGRHHPRRRRPGGRVPGLRQPAQPGGGVRGHPSSSSGSAPARRRPTRSPPSTSGPTGGRARRCPGLGHRPAPRDPHRHRETSWPATARVFSFASPPERQGHLAADALFPSAAAAGTNGGHLRRRRRRPAARRRARGHRRPSSSQRGVKVDGRHLRPRRQQAGSLEPPTPPSSASTRPPPGPGWPRPRSSRLPARPGRGRHLLAGRRNARSRPARGCPGGLALCRPGRRRGPGHPLGAGGGTSAPVLHGWATAKSLAAAIWRTGADTPAEVQAALEGLAGWSSGLAPPYETRPGTRSRTPEGVVFRVQSGAFAPEGGFRRDPY